MIPIKDDNPRRGFPLFTVGIILANSFAFYLEHRYGFGEVIAQWGAVPSVLLRGQKLETVVTSMFLHGGWLHIIGNMLYLWIFGDNIEYYLGHIRFVTFYLLCGVIAVATHILLGGASDIPMVGASGAVAGVLGAYLVKYPKAKVVVVIPVVIFLLVRAIPALFVLGFWFVMQLLYGLSSMNLQEGGVAFWAHVGGFVAGAVLVLIFPGRPPRRNISIV